MGHFDELMSTLLKFRENEILCDTILCMKDRDIKAHSIMLAAMIPVFKTAFECHGTSGTYQVDLPNIEAKVMEVAIHFIYTGTLLLPVDYKDMQKLNQLFLSLQELGLDTDRFNGCEMLFESSNDATDEEIRILKEEFNDPEIFINNDYSAHDELNASVEESGYEPAMTPETNNDSLAVRSQVASKRGIKVELDADRYENYSNDDTNEDGNEENERQEETRNEAGDRKKMEELVNQAGGQKMVYWKVGKNQRSVKMVSILAKKFACATCGKSFCGQVALQKHELVHTGERPHVCSYCSKEFSIKSNLDRHIRRHTGEKPYVCHLCGKAFIQKTSLDSHTKKHSFGIQEMSDGNNSIQYGCSHCDYTSKMKSTLQNHIILNHQGEKLYSGLDARRLAEERKTYLCDLCGKGYVTEHALKLHTLAHNGQKPFQCTICTQSFTAKAMLDYHTRQHTGEKPFACSDCNKKFICKLGLQQHYRTHTGERPYVCTVCDSRFVQSTHLKSHMRCHTGEKPNVCDHCGKAYKNRLDLRFHCKRVHNIDVTKHRTPVDFVGYTT